MIGMDTEGKIVDNRKTREELTGMVVIGHTEPSDAWKMCETISTSFKLEGGPDEAAMQLMNSDVMFDRSIKAYDPDTGDIYGLLTICDFDIRKGSPIMIIDPELGMYLGELRQINGHSFIIDERLRNSGLDKKMLMFDIDNLVGKYDFIWCGVEKTLKSHNYWKRLGFTELFSIEDATFYILPLSMRLFNYDAENEEEELFKEKEDVNQ